MVFALGFLTAGLVALACLPAVWRRAMRLTARRLGQLVPLSMDEIVAGRDQLRAGFAVGQRRLEQKLEQVEGARSQAMIEVGRRDVRILTLEDELAQERSRTASLADELGETTRELLGLRGETGSAAIALYDSEGLAEQRRWEALEAEEKNRALQNTVDEGRAAIAAFETRILGLEARVADLNQDLETGKRELSRANDALSRTTGERDAARQAAEAIAGKRDAAELRLDNAMSEVAQLKAALEQRGGSAETAERRAADLAQALAAQEASFEKLEKDRKMSEAALTAQTEAARNQIKASATTIEELRAEKAALSSALVTARQIRAEPPTDPTVSAGDLAALREAIKRVADDVLRMSGMPKPSPVVAPQYCELAAGRLGRCRRASVRRLTGRPLDAGRRFSRSEPTFGFERR